MSLDLYLSDVGERLQQFGGTQQVEPSAFDGFLRGTGIYAMKGLAKTARAVDMAGAVFPMLQDAISGGTESQERYFREHDEVFGSAVEYWSPKPLEVGVAAEIAGTLVGQLPLIVASPHLAVGAQVMDTAEELAAKGVAPGKAVAAGVVQGAGLATGIWMPILGQSLLQRVVLGGAGFNALQGMGTRAATELILGDSKEAEAFRTFDWKAITLDLLLGAAFGGITHLSPTQRAQGAEVWKRISDWMESRTPSEVAALATLRVAQHRNEDSLPGKPTELTSIEEHSARVKQAVDQLVKDQRVEVTDLPPARVEPDPERFAQAAKLAEDLRIEGERVAKEEGLPPIPEQTEAPAPKAEQVPTFEEWSAAIRAKDKAWADAEVERLQRHANGEFTDAERSSLISQRGSEKALKKVQKEAAAEIEKIKNRARPDEELRALYDSISTLDPQRLIIDQPKTEAPAANRGGGAEPPPPRSEVVRGEAAGAEVRDPLALEADRVASQMPDMAIPVGTDAEGKPVTVNAKDYLQASRENVARAREDASLFEIAAQCMLGSA